MAEPDTTRNAPEARSSERRMDIMIPQEPERRYLNCKVCENSLSQPQTLLPCLHTLCLLCAQRIWRQQCKRCPRCEKIARSYKLNEDIAEMVQSEAAIREGRFNEDELNEGEFNIAAITAVRARGKNTRYLVTWANAERETQWLKKEEIDAPDLFKQFQKIRNKLNKRNSREKRK